MVRYKRRRARYGLPAGALSFIGGWAIVAFLTPTSLMPDYPRWQVTLWVYLGAHFVKLSDIHAGGLGFSGLTVEEYAAGVPVETLPLVAIAAVAVAAMYTCHEISTSRVKHNVRNAMTAGTGYFLAALASMILSDIQPTFSIVLMLGLLVGGGIWVGSTFERSPLAGMRGRDSLSQDQPDLGFWLLLSAHCSPDPINQPDHCPCGKFDSKDWAEIFQKFESIDKEVLPESTNGCLLEVRVRSWRYPKHRRSVWTNRTNNCRLIVVFFRAVLRA